MVQFLALQIRMGTITIEQVPERYMAEVEELLAHKDNNAK